MSSIRCSFISSVLILFVIFAINKTHGQRRKVNWPCTTPEGESANCVPYAECPIAMEFLRKWLSGSKTSVPPNVQTRMNAMHCGKERNINYVCCDPKPKTTTALPPVTTSGVNKRSGGVKSEADIEPVIAFLKNQKCGENVVDKIANGDNVNLSEFPWMALLVYDDSVYPLACGGSLIHVRYVLTAAHCILSENKKLVSVRLGEHDTKSTEDCQTSGIGRQRHKECAPPIQEIDIEEAIYHKDFRIGQFANDIGLLRLATNANLTSNVLPICLPTTGRSRDHHLSDAIISGWGTTEKGTLATILQKAFVPIKTNEDCQQYYRFVQLTENQFCAGGGRNQTKTCSGDSGGPIFTVTPLSWLPRYIQYGVVSAGSLQCSSNGLDVFTKVVPYLPWIASNINLDKRFL